MAKPTVTVLSGMTLNFLSDSATSLVIDEELGRVVRDLEERGQDGKARSLYIQLDFIAKGGLVFIKPVVSSKLPKQAPPVTAGKITYDKHNKKNVIVFNPNTLNVDQTTLDDLIEETREKDAE